jgi:actin-related protein 2
METQEGTTLVCDIGTRFIKVGVAGKLTPDFQVPCIVGSPRSKASYGYNSNNMEENITKILIGDQALKPTNHRDKLLYRYPMDGAGVVQDWNALEMLLTYAMEEKLGVRDCSKYKLLIPKPYAMTKSDLERLVDFLFSSLKFKAITMHEQAALVLYTQGVESGIVVEAGESRINIVPVYMGHAIPQLDKRFPIGGRALSLHLIKLLRLKGYHLDAREDLETARQIKEKLCYVALDKNQEQRLAEETTVLVENYCLPDGSCLKIGRERFEACEALFQPSLLDSECSGLADLIFDTIQEADIDCRVELYKNIILSGGTALLPGIGARLEKDLDQRYIKDVFKGDETRSRNWKFGVHSVKGRDCLVFEGAALFADLISTERNFWVFKAEHAKFGIQLVLDKCKSSNNNGSVDFAW